MILKFSDMKNIAIGILSIWLLAACDPVVDNKEMGGIVSESELKLDVHATTDGGNEIIMTNNFLKRSNTLGRLYCFYN